MIKNDFCRLLIFVTFFQYGDLENGQGQSGIFLLTDFIDGLHQISLPKYEECAKTRAMHNFRLHFKMLEGFCHSTEGLLICYKSQLDGKNSAKFSQKFKIDQPANYSQIAKTCKEKFGENNSAQKWNGILLRQNNIASRNFTLELSLTNKTYHFENVNKLTIELGVPSSIKINGLQIEPDEEEMNFYIEFVKNWPSGAFMEDLLGFWAIGMDLLPAVGNNSNWNLSLYVKRSCKCSTKAWFLTDSLIQEESLKWRKLEYENDTGKCPADEMDQDKLKLVKPLKANEMANISVELIKHGNQKYKIQLFHIWTEKTWEKYDNGELLNITICFDSQQLLLENINKSAIYSLSKFTIGNLINEKNDGKFSVQIYQQQYFLAIGFMDQIVVKDYFIYNWWDRLYVNMIKFHGINVLEPPNIAPTEQILLVNNSLSYAFKLPGEVLGNQTIVLRAIMSEKLQMDVVFFYNTRQYRFDMFCRGKVEENCKYHFFSIGEFLFRLNIDPNRSKDNESIGIYIANSGNKNQGSPKFHNFIEPHLEPVQPFELRIRLPPRTFDAVNAEDKPIVGEEYKIYTNYNFKIGKFDIDKTLFPLWKINTIVVQGIQMLQEPTIQKAWDDTEEMAKLTDYSINIRQLNSASGKSAAHLLMPGEQIIIRGQVPVGAQEFCINLCFRQDNCMFEEKDKIGEHPINSHSQIGDAILHIRVILNATNKENEWNRMKINSWLRGIENWQHEFGPQAHSLQWGDNFTLLVEIPDDRWVFRVSLNGNEPLELNTTQIDCNPKEDNQKLCRMPPWTAEHLQIYGDVEINRAAGITRENHRNMLATMPFVRHFENGLEMGRKIVIDVEFNDDPNLKGPDEMELFRIGLYHDGIGNFKWFRETLFVGETLMELNFLQNGQAKIISFLNRNKKMVVDEGRNILWHRRKQIHVEIFGKKDKKGYYYKIQINNELTNFRTEFPFWAAEYLYIDNIQNGMFKLLEEPKY